ncbi:hypothetical protein QR680_002306 [Steinernema hermaphroditum]|uniref:G-protein coupled receptors family 1 profile domain-containing protein n=1 Tax=Steinernema hermaphroditum TaxID=289476 RepID=A0AA39H3Z1_9BILA|nr:hypothetical protein QR680_002306 [Steinernema hermaphroditum]
MITPKTRGKAKRTTIPFMGMNTGIANFIGIFAYMRYPALMLTPSAIPELSLLVSDFCVSCMHPFSGLSAIKNAWVWGSSGCQLYSFAGFFFGNYQCLAIPFIAYDRYIMITTSQQINTNRNFHDYVRFLLLLMAVSFAFSVMPLVGWGRYGLLPTKVTCTIDWTFESPSYYSFIVVLVIFLYILPLSTALYLYSKTYRHIASNGTSVHWAAPGREKMVITGCLVSTYVAFSGYGIACLLPFFIDAYKLHKIIYIIPGPMAKFTGILNAIFYIWLNPHVKKAIRKVFGFGDEIQVVIKYTSRAKDEETPISINTGRED